MPTAAVFTSYCYFGIFRTEPATANRSLLKDRDLLLPVVRSVRQAYERRIVSCYRRGAVPTTVSSKGSRPLAGPSIDTASSPIALVPVQAPLTTRSISIKPVLHWVHQARALCHWLRTGDPGH